jgi:mannose/cellobiose epimerase-like protein (N-acyl-D-glucosamine 2-epimerase family)
VLPKVFLRNFQNGWNDRAGGICKSFDLVARKPINSDLPWWELPETMRAAAELLVLFPKTDSRAEILDVLVRCSNAFLGHYVRTDLHLMAWQTRDAQGKPVDAIPGTPDADPGYHTGLSIIDMLACIGRLPDGRA